MHRVRTEVGNVLLRALPAEEFGRLRPLLTSTAFPVGHELEMPGSSAPSTYFIESGFVSAIIRAGSVRMDVGLIGREGMIGVPTLLGSDVSPYAVVVRHPLTALRVGVPDLQAAMRDSRAFGDLVIRYVQAATAQVMYNSLASAHLNVPARVARWLLMAHDRSGGDAITVTHAILSASVGVQRSGVTLALQDFERMKALRTARGSITITSRERLMAVVGPAYGPAEAAYRYLIPAPEARRDGVPPGSGTDSETGSETRA